MSDEAVDLVNSPPGKNKKVAISNGIVNTRLDLVNICVGSRVFSLNCAVEVEVYDNHGLWLNLYFTLIRPANKRINGKVTGRDVHHRYFVPQEKFEDTKFFLLDDTKDDNRKKGSFSFVAYSTSYNNVRNQGLGQYYCNEGD
jgi:hypothetical protein